MSVYLGQDKVGVSYMTSANMYEDSRTIMSNVLYAPWTRPQEWPNLDSLNLQMSGQDSFIYMTYRTGHVDDVCNFNTSLVSGTTITVELGTISNGIFTASSTETIGSGVEKAYWFTPSNGYSDGTIVVKITGRMTKFYLKDVTRDNADGGGAIKYYMQPMLERIWYVPEMTHFYNASSSSTTGNGTVTLQRDKIGNGTGNSLTSMYYAWVYCYDLQSLDLSNFNTPNVTNMASAFMNCRKLESLDVSHFNTSKSTNISYMFDGCYKIKELDLRTWDTQKISGTGLYYIFRNCYSLQEIKGLENFYTNNITSFAGLFSNCYNLKDLSGITYWNTSKVTNLAAIFQYCYKIKTLNLSHWDVSKVTNLGSMFQQCRSLEHIQFPQMQTATLSGSQASIFYYCTNLQEVDLSWFGPVTNKVTSIGYMFCFCRSLIEINIPEGWDITGCVNSESCYRIFGDCNILQRITGTGNWDMSGYNYSLAYMFQYDYCLKEINFKNWNPHPTSLYYAFYECYSIEEIDLSTWHFENLTGNGLSVLCNGCYSLKSIKGIEHAGDAGNITSLASMFSGCYSLTSIPNISSWDVSKVTSCSGMFNDCRQLQSLTITNWNLAKCTVITNMFRYCYNLQELELTGWSLPILNTNPDYIFCQLYNLKKCSGLPIGLNHRYQEAYSLPEDQWIRIFNQLPTVSNKTLYITTANINKLTSTTKAIATNKGWALAN